MNYITHLNEVLESFSKDMRLNPRHISVYMALFRQWNREHFPNWMTISRKEIMQVSKLGSTSTYHRIIKDLDSWKYISYRPSFRQKPASKVKVLRIIKKGIPLERRLSPKGSSLVGRPRPIGEQLTIYNKLKNIKEYLDEKNESLKEAFQKKKLDEKEYPNFLLWLDQHYLNWDTARIGPKEIVSRWLTETSNLPTGSHNGDNQEKKEKRYDQPL